MKLLTFSMILFLILSGCAHTKDYEPAPEMLAPNKDDLANIKTIGVLPATSHVYQSKLLLHDVVHKSMGEGAAEGASYALHGGAGGDIIIDLIIRPVVALVGGVSGAVAAAANPIEKPVHATDKQNQITSAIFTAGLKSITYAENILQSALVDFGNSLASYSFEEVHGIGSISTIEDEQISKKERLVDAIIRPAELQIILVGEQLTDPLLQLVVKGHYILSKSNQPDNCIGWFSSTSSGNTKILSLWRKDDAEHLKVELRALLEKQAREVIKYLFNSDELRTTKQQEYDTYPDWLNCYEARYQKIVNHADWYCRSADSGIADSQRRIGDLYYRSGTSDGLINAYMWYSLAVTGNNTEAAKNLDLVLKELTPEQHAQAEHLLDAWKPGSCKKDLLTFAKQRPATN